jgi:hypothetical protein
MKQERKLRSLYAVNVLLVVGNERLHVEMSKLMSTNKTVTVIRVPKNGGVRLSSFLSCQVSTSSSCN